MTQTVPATITTVVAAAALLVLECASALAQLEPLNPSRYRIVDAPESETAFLASAHSFAWVDNDRILFIATDKELSETEKRGPDLITKRAVYTIHLWDLEKQAIKRYRDEPLSKYLCASNGHVAYGLSRGGKTVVLEGAFGREQERPDTSLRTTAGGAQLSPRLNKFTCKEYWFADLPRPNGGRSFPLKTEDGVLEDRGWNPTANRPSDSALGPPFARWIHIRDRSIELDFPQQRISEPAFSGLLDAYVFTRPDDRLAFGKTNRVYVLFRKNWEVRSIEILGSQNWKQLHNVAFTRAGLIAESNSTSQPNKKWDPGPSGLYLFHGPIVEGLAGLTLDQAPVREKRGPSIYFQRINRGLIDAMSSVSPDGCKVAVTLDPWDGENRKIAPEVIDFCRKGE